ncbi:hypothetical protein [Methylobacterium nonmethylotrophicum]|uniref:Uncharacterized protein n=1 Tax=Methylobacterium nonmethylotrophicum TaxID=1141884 RepID=A0A4Z0NG53_9HYPH|nr:hypothetical protein [Methylobacterium nonmethylotrophicum]TGD94926.1 hypothetical protein EU555_30615 [Methylobacterium nonmethylotrophicum]
MCRRPFVGPVALIRCDSSCQTRALVAQFWTHRLRRQVVIGANAGCRAGFIHFGARSASVPDLIAFLLERARRSAPMTSSRKATGAPRAGR